MIDELMFDEKYNSNLVKERKEKMLPSILALTIVAIFFLVAIYGDNFTVQSIELQQAKDFQEQYYRAKSYESPVEQCARAGLVAEAYLQADVIDAYQMWKSIEKRDCAALGTIEF